MTISEAEGRKRRGWLYLTAGPGVLWLIAFLLIPCIGLLGIAFFTSDTFGLPVLPLTTTPFAQVAGFSIFGWDAGNLAIVLRSFEQAGGATLLTAALAYPIVFFIIGRPPAIRPLLLLLLVVPSWTNQVVRTYAWLELLGPDSLVTRIARALSLVPPHLGLAPGSFAVTTGLAYNYLPYVVVPLYASAERMDWSLVEAGRDLYASGMRLFWHAVFPQTLPGLLAGITFVAIPAFGDYVVPQLLGGNRALMLGSLIANQFTATPDWPYGAALTTIMLALTGIGLALFRVLTQKLGGGTGSAL